MNRALAALAVTLVLPWYAAERPAWTLSPDQIRAAIEWGTKEVPKPYDILGGIKGAKTSMGVLYTPQQLVGLAAHSAAEAGKQLTAEDISPESIRPAFYVVMWQIGEEGTPSHDARTLELVPRQSTDLLGSKESIRPLWVSTHPVSDPLLKQIDVPRGGVLAAFDLSALRSGKFLASYVSYPSGDLEASWGIIPEHIAQ
jgi:hypothetical protein